MSAIAAPLPGAMLRPPRLPIGRAFVHPLFDLLVIGSLLSLALTPLFLWSEQAPELGQRLQLLLPFLVLVSNSSHFAASTVRLYTKPGASREMRFLTMGFPLLTIALATLTIAFAEALAAPLQMLYLTWSPYHYAAQAYGLGLMYAYRSGCALGTGEKRVLRLACLLPFGAALLGGRSFLGTAWVGPRLLAVDALAALGFALPVLVCVRRAWLRLPGLPLISLAAVFSNVVWLVILGRAGAFAWATIFHGLQYLAIVTIFHVKDRLRQPDNRHGWAWHAASFYAACLALGYGLFQLWPYAYVLAGFGVAESMLTVAAVINLHHFIVDGFIWKLRQAPNRSIVTDAA